MTTAALDGFAPRCGAGRWLAVGPFVLMFNFGAGSAYALGGLATLFRRRWAIWMLVLPRLLEGGRHA